MSTQSAPIEALREQIKQHVFGQDALVENILTCMLASGHVLMTGVPGLAKTSLVRVISQSMQMKFRRVQFTSDLLPSDITGAEILEDDSNGKRSFTFKEGPVFTNILLADEINRASPRTQSALLEAMQEKSVTVSGCKHEIDRPFLVLATQNPIESEGTFPLPEAQLDRFMMHLILDYPDFDSEMKILKAHAGNNLIGEQKIEAAIQSIMTKENFSQMALDAREMKISDQSLQIMNELVRSTRPEDELCDGLAGERIRYGAGPRAGITLVSCSKALAYLQGDSEVTWSHIRSVFKPIMRHRIKLHFQFRKEKDKDVILDDILERFKNRYQKLTGIAV